MAPQGAAGKSPGGDIFIHGGPGGTHVNFGGLLSLADQRAVILYDQLDSGMLYLSDHGESLGEYNLFLHGAPYLMAPEQQRHVSMFAWFSKGYQRDFNVSSQCLRDEHERPLSHDNLFHSMLGIMDVQTQVYDGKLDLFKPCRAG